MYRSETGDWLVPLANLRTRDESTARIAVGEGLIGQCAVEQQRMLLTDIR